MEYDNTWTRRLDPFYNYFSDVKKIKDKRSSFMETEYHNLFPTSCFVIISHH